MADIDRYRPDDRRQVEALYRRVFGPDMAEANRLRWDWQYRRNPHVPADGPLIWIAREGTTIVGQYADDAGAAVASTASEIDGAWGMDVMVAPERQRQGLGDVLFRTWDRSVGASLGLGLSDVVVPAVPEAAVARRRPGAVPRQAAEPARAAAAELAGRPQPARVRTSRCRGSGSSRASRPLEGEVAADPPLRRELHAALGAHARTSSRSPCGATRRT